MTTLRYVVFGQPIPVADTHRREPRFESDDGWSITRDASSETWRIVGHGVDFVTDGINSWSPSTPNFDALYASAVERELSEMEKGRVFDAADTVNRIEATALETPKAKRRR